MNQILVETGRQIVMEAPQLYIDIDVEADGKPGYGSLLSIGAITPDGETYYTELQPSSPVYIKGQRDFCEAHGLERSRLLREAPRPATAMQDFKNWLDLQIDRNDKTPVFTAFNAGFDYGHIDLEFIKAGISNPFGVSPFCLKSLTHMLVPGWDWRRTIKDNLPADVKPEGEFTHHALEDAAYQQKLHFGLAGLLSDSIRLQLLKMPERRTYFYVDDDGVAHTH